MSPRFKTGNKARLLDRRFRKSRRKKIIIITLICLILIPGGVYLLQHYVELTWKLAPANLDNRDNDFDPELVYSKAKSLIEEGKANEFRGRRAIVTEKFNEALELLETLRDKAPHFKREEVTSARLEMERKLRKAK